jgi:DNA-binding transcriptional ArsR family regulator
MRGKTPRSAGGLLNTRFSRSRWSAICLRCSGALLPWARSHDRLPREQLGRSDASITDLSEMFHMTLTVMKKHVRVLEQAGLVSTEKIGRVRTCKLGKRRLEEETAWLERYRQLWDLRFDELDKVVEELNRKEEIDGR